MTTKILATCFALLITAPAFAQFGGGGSLKNSATGLQYGDYFDAGNIVVAISKSGKIVTTFSSVTGKTTKLTLKEKVTPSTPFVPISGANMVCFVHGKTVYTFGAKQGKWIHIETEETPTPYIQGGKFMLRVGAKLYICSAASTEWQVMDVGEEVEKKRDEKIGGGGGGFFSIGGGLNDNFGSRKIYGTYVETFEVGVSVAISNSGKSVTAFSDLTGKTAKLNFDNKIEPYVPMVTTGLVCFMHEKTAYAFSAQTGKWDSVKTKNGTWVPVASGNLLCFVDGNTAYAVGKNGKWMQVKAKEAPNPIVYGSGSRIRFQVGSKLYICSAASTEWQVIDLESDE